MENIEIEKFINLYFSFFTKARLNFIYAVIVFLLLLSNTAYSQPLQLGQSVLTQYDPFASHKVVKVIDIRNRPPFSIGGTQWNPTQTSGADWTYGVMGNVFGITLDGGTPPNIFCSRSTAYDCEINTNLPGLIYRIDGNTWGVTDYIVKNNIAGPPIAGSNWIPNTGPGLGNLCYEKFYHQIYVTNHEDGKIYIIEDIGGNGIVRGFYDPFAADNLLPGFAPRGERLWGIGTFGTNSSNIRLYFSRWRTDLDIHPANVNNEIWSVGLDNTGFFNPGTLRLEITLPSEVEYIYSQPVSDIEFSNNGDMLLGERTMEADICAGAHVSRILEYPREINGLYSNNNYIWHRVGSFDFGKENSCGGVDFGFGISDPINNIYSECDSIIVGTGDYLFRPNPSIPQEIVYGVQVTKRSSAGVYNVEDFSHYIDLNGVLTEYDKTTPGDIDVYRKCLCDIGTKAGDYTIGLVLFNKVTGKNITFERKVTKVKKEFPIVESGQDVYSNDPVKVKMEIREVEKIYWVPMQNGKIYDGPLYIMRTDYPDLPEEAMSGVYATITAAVEDLNIRGSCGSVRFLLADASYPSETLPITINSWPGSSSSSTLTIQPNTGVNASITGSNSTAIFDINNGDYIIIEGSNSSGDTTKNLTISNTNTSGSAIRFVNDASNNIVTNCILKGVSSAATNGVVFFSSTTGTTGNDKIIIQNNDITSGATSPVYGIYNLGSGTTSDVKNSGIQIIGNRIFNFANAGIRDDGNSVKTIYQGNEIYESITQSTQLQGFRTNSSSIEGFAFSNNNIHDLKTVSAGGVQGIVILSIQGVQNVGEVTNNFINLSETLPATLRGIYIANSDNGTHNVYFNSISLGGSVSGSKFSDCIYIQGGNNINLWNNIFSNTRSGGTGKHYAIRTGDTSLNLVTANYNDIFNSGSTGNVLGNYGGSDITTLSAWIIATGKDSNSVSANPQFISNSNLHIASPGSSLVSNAGTPISGITTDIDNDFRNAFTPDIGADEFDYFRILNLTVYIQGFYNPNTNTMIQDTVSVYLRNSASPYAIADYSKAYLNLYGTGTFSFSNAVNNVNYYIQVNHRNSIETWSDSARSFLNSSLTYDFSTSITKAFGNNMIQVDASPVRFAISSGDINQDGTIDLSDGSQIDNDAFNFVSGYVQSDVNGDGVVDITDAGLADNNAFNFVSKITP